MSQGICSNDRQRNASFVCACVFPLPSLCPDCQEKHCLTPGFHFLIPISSYTAISSQRDLMALQQRLFGIDTAFKKLRTNLNEIRKCEEEIEAAFQSLVYSAEVVKKRHLERLASMRDAFSKVFDAVIAETTAHVLDAYAYKPETPLGWFVWNQESNLCEVLDSFKFQAECIEEFVEKALHVAFENSIPGLEQFNEGKMSKKITVNVTVFEARIVTVDVRSDGIVRDVKQRIQDIEGIPVEYQYLYHNDRLLSSDCYLSDFKIKHQSFFTLKISKIVKVSVCSQEKQFSFAIESKDRISNLKAKIQEIEGIAIDLQILTYEDVFLEDECCFETYRIQSGAEIKLNIRDERNIRLSVVWSEGRVLKLETDKSDTVKRLTDRVISETGWQRSPTLLYNGRILDKHSIIANLNLPPNSYLQLFNQNGPMTHLIVAIPSGNNPVIKCCSPMPISAVKGLICELTKIQPEKQVLCTGGILCYDIDSLSTYNLIGNQYVKLTLKSEERKITVKMPSGRDVILTMDQKDNVRDLKKMLEKAEGIPAESQKIVCEGEVVDDRAFVEQAFMTIDKAVALKLEDVAGYQLSLIVLGGKKVTRFIDEDLLISKLKTIVSEIFDIAYSTQTLFYGNKKLEDNRTLMSYSIPTRSSIYVLVQYQ